MEFQRELQGLHQRNQQQPREKSYANEQEFLGFLQSFMQESIARTVYAWSHLAQVLPYHTT